MQIILTKEEFDNLKPIHEYTAYQLANALVDKCKLNEEAKTTTFEIHTMLSRKQPQETRPKAKYKIVVELVEVN